MTDFLKITKENIKNLAPYLEKGVFGLCDYTLPTVYMWSDFFGTEYAFSRGMLLLRHTNFHGKTAYLYPVGEGDAESALDELFDFCGGNISFCIIPEEHKRDIRALAERHGAVCGDFFNDIGWNDYIYRPESVLGFPGKKLHGQKNHLNFFKKNNIYEYNPLTSDGVREVIDFVKNLGISPDAGDIEKAEYRGTLEYLENYRLFPMSCGGYIKIGDDIAAATIAERQGEYLIIHTEKADKRFRGAYQAVFDALLQNELTEGIRFVNREEDCGDEGLRYAKNAYHPDKMLKKYTVTLTFEPKKIFK